MRWVLSLTLHGFFNLVFILSTVIACTVRRQGKGREGKGCQSSDPATHLFLFFYLVHQLISRSWEKRYSQPELKDEGEGQDQDEGQRVSPSVG